MMEEEQSRRQIADNFAKIVRGLAILVIGGSLIAYYRHRNHQHREIDPDWYASNPSHTFLQTPKRHKRSDL